MNDMGIEMTVDHKECIDGFQKDEQRRIADVLGVNPDLSGDAERLAQDMERRVRFLATTLKNSGLTHLVLGISGGIDSFVTGMLCQKAIDQLNAQEGDRYRFVAMRLPYRIQRDAADVDACLAVIAPSIIEEVNIGEGVDAISQQLSASYRERQCDPSHVDFVKGNMKARMRMLAQYAVAGSYGGLVVGTDHASEAVMGFFTKFGDGACDVTPLAGLTKGQVRALARSLNVPASILEKAPTADLESLDEAKPDEEAFGVSYDNIEDFLLNRPIPFNVFWRIRSAYGKTEHKRALPVTP